MLTPDRTQIRKAYYQAWQKHSQGQPLDALEKRIVAVLLQHPEYHYLINDAGEYLERDFRADRGETNPFLHLGLHISILEQIETDRPPGIREVYQQLCSNKDSHDAEHEILDTLAMQLWRAQQKGIMPDDASYLKALKELVAKK